MLLLTFKRERPIPEDITMVFPSATFVDKLLLLRKPIALD